MRILILSQYFYPEVGATQTRMYEFARRLTEKGFEVTVITEFPNHPHGRIPRRYRWRLFETEMRDGFRICRVWVWASPRKSFATRMAFYFSFLLLSVFRSLSAGRQDIVLATSPPLFVGAAGCLTALLKRAPLVLDIRDLWPAAAVALGELRRERFIRWAERLECFLYRKAKRILVVTRGFRDHIESLGIDSHKITVIPNGTQPSLFQPRAGRAELSRENGLADRFIVTFAGNLGLAQGLGTVLDAAQRCRNDSSLAFLLIGGGPLACELRREAERRRLKNVHFKPQMSPAEVVPYLNASNALLVHLKAHPVFRTFVPSKLFDYMACAKPVLLGLEGEASLVLEKAGAGVCFPAEDPEALLSAVRTLQADPALCRRMGRNGRKHVMDHYDRQQLADLLASDLNLLHARDGGRK